MRNENLKKYVQDIHMHGVLGAAFILPIILTSFSLFFKFLDNQITLDYLTIALPALLMIAPLTALYITTFRHLRVKGAKASLSLLSCGICYASLCVGNKFLGGNISLCVATLTPYVYVRIIGKRLLKQELALSETEILYLNERVI